MFEIIYLKKKKYLRYPIMYKLLKQARYERTFLNPFIFSISIQTNSNRRIKIEGKRKKKIDGLIGSRGNKILR